MARSGPNPGAANQAALGREPIILRGFDRDRQLDINFRTVAFGTCWLRRTYTNGTHNHITLRTRNDEHRLHEVRYGNNITVLLKACYHLRQYYTSSGFWPAVAQGFGASADVVRDMVELFVDARSTYRKNNPDEDRLARSGTNVAADKWLDFLANRRRDSAATRSNDSLYASSVDIHGHARYFYKESEGREVDLANVLPKKIDYLHYSPPGPRKRSASPEPPGRAPSPKRRPSDNDFNRAEPLHARLSQPLPPLETRNQIKGSARQDDRTPTSASERPGWARSPTNGFPNDATETFPKIRGTASQSRNGLPAIDSCDPMPNRVLFNDSSDTENHKLRARVATLEKELASVKSCLFNDQHYQELVVKILCDHGLIPSSAPDPGVETLQARPASRDGNTAEEATRHAQEIKEIRESISSAKDHIVLLNDCLMKKVASASNRDQDIGPTLHALENAQARLASLEDKLLVQETENTQTKRASRESRVATIQSHSQEPKVPVDQESTDTLTVLDNGAVTTSTKQHHQSDLCGMLDSIPRLEDSVNRIDNRVTQLEGKPDKNEHVRELESRVTVIEHQQNRLQETYADSNLVETKFEHWESRLSNEKDAATEQLQNIHQRLMAIEIQSSRLLETADEPKASKSTSPSRHVQQNMGEMLKTINSLPTTTSVSDMVDKRDQVLKADIDTLRRKLNDMSTKIDNLPNQAHISEKVFRLGKGLRADLERHQKQASELLEGSRKDIETLQIQVKGLNKLWNEATSGIAKSESLLALKLELDALKGDFAIQSKKFDGCSQGLNDIQNDTIANLERRVADLSTKAHTAFSEVTPENLLNKLQEVYSNIDARLATRDARIDALVQEIETLRATDSILARALSDASQLMQRA
ncbi:hypothetical protein N0V93_006497 [Gnomoniopsis smithogilvyi]|uniref:Uncharacterized protein n=1 Tax=Gnomoniopsis smithogilvyi TaxID=1191159 RepID=A0A9W8YNQ9_9PEZI|nr:hypothetical protein N0V93_006497 [Gnomoniopsis smithogilvyi]